MLLQNNNNADLNDIENIALYSEPRNIYSDENIHNEPKAWAATLKSIETSQIKNIDTVKSVEVTGKAIKFNHKERAQRYLFYHKNFLDGRTK